MREPEAYATSIEFVRNWRSRFQTAYDALRQQEKEAREAVQTAERRLGAALPCDGGDEEPDADPLSALQARVHDLARFDEAVELRARIVARAERPARGEPLSAWKCATEATLPRVDALLMAAGHDGIAEARTLLEGREAALEEARRSVVATMRDGREAAADAWEAFAEVRDLLRGDVERMGEDLVHFEAMRRDADRGGVWGMLGAGFGFCALGGGVGFMTQSGLPIGQALHAGVTGLGWGLVIGLGVGLLVWVRRAHVAAERVGALVLHVEELEEDARAARAEVLGDLARLRAESTRHEADAVELDVPPNLADFEVIAARVEDPAATAELVAFAAHARSIRTSSPRLWAAVGVSTVLAGLVFGALAAMDPWIPPAPPPPPEDDGLIGEPTVAPGEEPSPEVPTEPPAPEARYPFRPGTWAGTYGLGSIRGRLTEQDNAVRGVLHVVEPAGEYDCRASGRLSSGGRIRLVLEGCIAAGVLQGKLTAGGRVVTGSGARKTGRAEVVDAWNMGLEEGE